MRTNRFLWHLMHGCICAVLMVFMSACGGEDFPIPIPEDVEGEVTFVIDNNTGGSGNSGTGTGTPEDPAQVPQGETLSMVVSQESSYTDPNGNVYTCEPKATIEVFAVAEKVYAKDIKALTTISDDVKLTTNQSGDNPVINSTNQVFKIGEQEVVFDLGYEIYTYVNSYSQNIEMPYIKVNQAEFGTGSAAESNPKSSRSAISLKSLSLTRASVTESTEFEVTVRFSLELESVNTKQQQAQSLEFEVKYIGVVEEVTELYGDVAYDINGGNGTSFSLVGGKELTLTINQTSTYAKDGDAVYTYNPKALIKLKANSEAVEAESAELLGTLIETSDPVSSTNGQNPLVYSYEGSFGTVGQLFDFETSYEVYTSENGDQMPYLKIGEPKCVGIEVAEVSATRAVETTYYDVKAKFEVELVGVNVKTPISKTLTFDVTYQGSVSVQQDDPVKLVDVKYRKDVVFTLPHDNLTSTFKFIVYRDRYYSDGSVQTDTFTGLNYMCFDTVAQMTSYPDHIVPDTLVEYGSGYKIQFMSHVYAQGDGIVSYSLGSCVLPSIDNIMVYHMSTNNKYFKEFVENFDSSYTLDLSHQGFNPNAPVDGWYMKRFNEDAMYRLYCPDYDEIVRNYQFEFGFTDRFLYIDNTLIDFAEYRIKYDNGGPVLSEEDIPESDKYGPGRIYRFDLTGEYLGQKFHHYIVDTVYTFKR